MNDAGGTLQFTVNPSTRGTGTNSSPGIVTGKSSLRPQSAMLKRCIARRTRRK
ncbi:hypothetical protein C8T65DRAFT_660960 [Cerioporus squamosus]|nr:hypothetical protein C8T65DRAFT_660960 [Cerioporus squamosus]